MLKKALIAAAAAAAFTAPAGAVTIYFDNFDGGESIAPGISRSVVAGGATQVSDGSAGGISGGYFRNDTAGQSSITLTGVSGYRDISFNFDLAFIDSWDSTNGNPSPDYLYMYINGQQVLQLTSANTSGNVTELGGGTQTAFGSFFYNGGFNDRVVNYSNLAALTFANTAGLDSVTFAIQAGGAGFQYGSDESWGADNFRVDATLAPTGAVPEPATWAMMIGGIGAVGGTLRRRKARTTLRFA